MSDTVQVVDQVDNFKRVAYQARSCDCCHNTYYTRNRPPATARKICKRCHEVCGNFDLTCRRTKRDTILGRNLTKLS